MSDSPDRYGRAADPLARYWRPAVLAVVAAAVVLRLPWPSAWWLNPDEGIYYWIITHARFADFWADAMATAHPPLYFLLLRAVAFLTTDFAWLRSVALLSGVAAVYAFIVLGREVGGDGTRGRLTGLLAGILLAASPRAIALSQVVRPYMLLLLLLAAALFFLLRFLRLRSNGLLVGYAACASLALTLHYSAVGALGVFGLLVVADGARSGFGRPEWRRLGLAQLVPGFTLVGLYVWHLRGLMGSAIADQALEGWLSAYLVRGPPDVWLGLVGVHSSLVGDALAASATLLTVVGLGWAGWTRRWTVLLMGGAAIALATIGAVAGLYPFGATRHAAWLIAFLGPTLAWAVATMLMEVPGARVATMPHPGAPAPAARPARAQHPLARAAPVLLLVALLVGAGPLGSVLDSERRPREISERVLQVAHVDAMSEVLSPRGGPRLVLMSTETYQLLAPLFVDRTHAVEASSRGGLLHFPWGVREVVVLPGRDFAALPRELARSNHLYTATRRATEEFGIEGPAEGESLLVLAGGWYSQGMEDLVALAGASPGLGTSTHVPGLIAVALDFEVYRRALGVSADGDDQAVHR
jgi:hypothetical protein